VCDASRSDAMPAHCVSVSFFASGVLALAMSSIGLGGGVVAMVHPIQPPMVSMAMKATRTGVAMIQNCTFDCVA